MPIYNFICKRCDYEFSSIMKYKEKKILKDPRPCPKCYCGPTDENTLFSTIGKTSFSLKGKGWYKDGY